jgi:hypothetical protein
MSPQIKPRFSFKDHCAVSLSLLSYKCLFRSVLHKMKYQYLELDYLRLDYNHRTKTCQ